VGKKLLRPFELHACFLGLISFVKCPHLKCPGPNRTTKISEIGLEYIFLYFQVACFDLLLRNNDDFEQHCTWNHSCVCASFRWAGFWAGQYPMQIEVKSLFICKQYTRLITLNKLWSLRPGIAKARIVWQYTCILAQWRSQPKNLGGQTVLEGTKMFDFRRITLFCLEKCLSKNKMTVYDCMF